MDKKNENCECKDDTKEYKSINDAVIRKYIHDIKNAKIMTKEELIYINNLPPEDRMQILIAYNTMTKFYTSLFE